MVPNPAHPAQRDGQDSADDEGDRIVLGRRAPYSMVGDWVLLADVHATAKTLYGLMCAHVNVSRGDQEVWPKRKHLARMLRLSRANSVTPHMQALVKLGAVDVRQERTHKGMRVRNVYTVHEAPPPGYDGLTSLVAFYDLIKAEDAAADQESAGHTEGRSTAPPDGDDESAGHTEGRSTASPGGRSTAPRRGRSTAPRGGRSTARELDEGFELDEVEQDELPPPSRPSADPDLPGVTPGGGPEEEEAAARTVQADAFIRTLPRKGRRVGAADRAELVERIAGFIAEGCDMSALRRGFATNLVGVKNVEPTLLYRLRDGQLLPADFMPSAPPLSPVRPDWQLTPAAPERVAVDGDPEALGAIVSRLGPNMTRRLAAKSGQIAKAVGQERTG